MKFQEQINAVVGDNTETYDVTTASSLSLLSSSACLYDLGRDTPTRTQIAAQVVADDKFLVSLIFFSLLPLIVSVSHSVAVAVEVGI